MANIDLSLTVICNQLAKRRALNDSLYLTQVKPFRYETKNPYLEYPGYSQRDFAMRRKAEILKYNNTASQSNPRQSHSQQWAQFVNGSSASSIYNDVILYQNDGSGNYYQIVVKYPDTYSVSQSIIGYDINDNPVYMDVYNVIPGRRAAPCTKTILTPTSSSGVPGPIMDLYLDETVPLVYYNTNVNSYGLINPNNTDPWTTVTNDNIFFSDSINNLFMNLIINNSIENYAYTFQIQTPICLYFTATVNTDVADGHIYLPNNSISIGSISAFTFYNSNPVTYQVQPQYYIDDEQPINFDISFNKGYVNNITYDSNGIAINNSYYNNTITGSLYIGTLTVSNLYLLTAPSYIYDIDLNFVMDTEGMNSLFSSYFTTLTVGVKCNVDATNYINIAKNITVDNTDIYPLTAFQFTGA